MGCRSTLVVVIAGCALVAAGCSHASHAHGPTGAPTTTVAPAAAAGCHPASAAPAAGTLPVSTVCHPTATSPSPTARFGDVAFPDPAHGWAAGTDCSPGPSSTCGGIIEATTDGGAHWAVQYRDAVAIGHLDFVDDRHGWAIGEPQGCGPGTQVVCADTVLTTTDGGGTWAPVAGIGGDLRDVHFTDPRAGWLAVADCPAESPGAPACPGEILASTDGGAHWAASVRTAGPVLALTSAGSRVWAVEALAGTGTAGTTLAVLSSRAGSRWVRLAEIPTESEFDPGTVAAINVFSPTQGWLSVFQQSSCAMHGCGVAALYRTVDGGSHWAEASIASGRPECGVFEPTFALAPGGVAYAAEGVNLATCSPPASTLSAWAPTGWRPVHAWAANDVLSMAWPDPSQGWAVTGDAVIHTADGGATWDQQLPAPRPVADMAFTDPIAGWGAGTVSDPGAVLHTGDGGLTWTVTAVFAAVVHQVSAAGPDVWATLVSEPADKWSVLESSDGGTTWTALFPPPPGGTPAPLGVSELSMFGTTGVAVTTTGFGGWGLPGGLGPVTYSTTDDGGHSWENPRVLPVTQLGDASFSDPAHGWALDGATGALIATADGARTWTTLGTMPAGTSPTGIELLTPTTGWVWSTDPTGQMAILATGDGGRSWTRDDLPPVVTGGNGPGTPQVLFIDPGHGWLLTAAGLWATTDGGRSWSALPS